MREIKETMKDVVIGTAQLVVGIGVSIVAGNYVNKKVDTADARLNPKKKGFFHRGNKSSVKKTK